ncbi:MAG: WYL domain-containing protein [Eubacterium sp.]|nr:WYL domain-containing protein [Eubacterium sp.]
MGKGKQNAAGQAQRRQQIIDFIKENGPVKSGVICAALSLSRSSLSDDINAINAQTSVLTSPKRGYYAYDPQAAGTPSAGVVRGKLDSVHIRQWYILSLLSTAPYSFDSLLGELQTESIRCAESTLHADLKMLQDKGYVTSSSEYGEHLYRSYMLHPASLEELSRYYSRRKKKTTGSRVQISAYESIERKIAHGIPEHSLMIKKSYARHTGKQNTLSSVQLGLLQQFQQYPYETHTLSIPYVTNAGKHITWTFSTGLIVYSVETSRIYLLGKNQEKRNTVIALDRADLEQIEILSTHNYCYRSPEFFQIEEEMFSISVDDPVTVRVRFDNMPFITSKLDHLLQMRKHSKTELINEGTEILYTDTLRGIPDFARYLRRFGHHALAEEPMELKERMLYTSRKVLELYEE